MPAIAWGLAAYANDGETADQLLEAADRAMYRQKTARGRSKLA